MKVGDAIKRKYGTATRDSGNSRGTVSALYHGGGFQVTYDSVPNRAPGAPRGGKFDYPASARSLFEVVSG